MERLAKGKESFDTEERYRKKRDLEKIYEWYVADCNGDSPLESKNSKYYDSQRHRYV